MIADIVVPSLGKLVSLATITHWQRENGELVAAGEVVCTLEAAGVALDVCAPEGGRLEIMAGAGSGVMAGNVIGKLFPPPPGGAVSSPGLPEPNPAGAKRGPSPVDAGADRGLAGPQAPPAPSQLQPSRGGRGVIVVPDAPMSAPTRFLLPPERLAETRALLSASQETAKLTTFHEVDMSAVLALRSQYGEAFRQRHGIRLGFMSFAARSTCFALGEVPVLNDRIEGDEIVHCPEVDLGIAVSTDRGPLVPVVRGAGRLSLPALEREIARLAERGRSGQLLPDELRGGTFSITNVGVFGSLLATPMPVFPQAGILGLHVVQDRPVAREGQVVIRPMMYVSLSYDLRLVGGREAATFLLKVKEFLEGADERLLELTE